MFRTPAKKKEELEVLTWEEIQRKEQEKAEEGEPGSPLEELLKERIEKRRSLENDSLPPPPLKQTTCAERRERDREVEREIENRRREKGLPPAKAASVTPPSPTTSKQGPRKKGVTLKFSPPPSKAKQTVAGPKPELVVNKTYTRKTPPEVPKKVANTNNPMHNKRYDRLFEAKEQLQASTEHLNNSRNLKTEIKQSVAYAVKRLYALLCQCDKDLGEALIELHEKAGKDPGERESSCKEVQTDAQLQEPVCKSPVKGQNDDERIRRIEDGQSRLTSRMEEQSALLQKSLECMNNLQQIIHECKTGSSVESAPPKLSYASVAAARPVGKPPVYRTLHSVAINSKKANRMASETLTEVRKALNAMDGGVEVERVRQAKNGQVIISCRTAEEREKLTCKLMKSRKDLTAENIANKQPMVMITGVLRIHTDEDLFRALKNQNKQVFEGLEKVDESMEVAYKIRGRNPNTQKVVLKVTSPIWRRLTEVGFVKIDLQNLQVTDRSPLTQCSMCLAFGHGKKRCEETQIACSHCGGPHTRAECEERIVGAPPRCKNCIHKGLSDYGHNAFSEDCPIRARWDAIVRATVAYE